MGQKHTEIEVSVQQDWTRESRGRLFRNANGWAKKVGVYGLGVGTSDLIGFELVDGNAIFCAIEVKTKAYPTLSEEQRDFLNMVTQWGGKTYIAMETDEGYEIDKWMVI